MRNRRSVAGNQNLRREIFDIRRAASFFISCFALPAALGTPPPASRIFGRESNYPPAQSICKLRNKCRSCVRKLLARSGFYLLRAQKNRWTISNLDRIFSAAGRRSNASPETRAFLRLAGSCRRHFGPFAGNPNRQPEIQKNRWKSAEVAELFCSCG